MVDIFIYIGLNRYSIQTSLLLRLGSRLKSSKSQCCSFRHEEVSNGRIIIKLASSLVEHMPPNVDNVVSPDSTPT
jgi:hypothetical protein